MSFVCQHCSELRVGRTYRVISEEDGICLLDMVVCDACYRQAKKLGLNAEEIDLHDRLDSDSSQKNNLRDS